MDYRIDYGVTNGTLLVCKPNSQSNNSHGTLPQNHDWAVKQGEAEGGKPKGGRGDNGGAGGMGSWGNKGGKGAPYGRGRW